METIQTENKYYQSITDLPLHNYVNCLVDKNLSELIISGQPSFEQLSEAWEIINQEYADQMGNEGYDLYLTLSKEIALLEVSLTLVENCVEILKMVFEQKYADKINEILRTNIVFDWTNQDEYRKELDKAIIRSKSIVIQIQLKKSQLEGQEKRFKADSKAPTKEYFESVLITLSDHAKHQIRDDISVYNFCERIRRLNVYIKQIEKDSKK